MPLRVLITRPEADARALADTLSQLGIEPVICPLLEITYTPDITFSVDNPDALIFTSKHGVRSVANITALRGLPAICVGNATAETAIHYGFSHVTSAGGDVAALHAYIKQHFPSPARFTYISGKHIAHDVGALLAADGHIIAHHITYDAIALKKLPLEIHHAIKEHSLEAVLFFSARTAGIFTTLINQENLTANLTHMQAFCLSPAIAKNLGELPWKQIHSAKEPTQEALLEFFSL